MPTFKNDILPPLKLIFIAIVLSFGISAISLYLYKVDTTLAKIDPPVISFLGHVWADNIGWISLNCANQGSCAVSNYKVSMDDNGNMSGYAWSENIGWLSFNPGDVAGCPSAPCSPVLNRFFGTGQGAVTGWFKALSGGTVGSGGWDGFVKLSGTWTNGVSAGAYPNGVNGSGTGLSGFAWGSDVVGWVDFGNATADSLLVCSSDWRVACPTAPNSCGLRNFGTIQCDGSCSAVFPPPESSCNVLNVPTGGGGTSACPSLTLDPQTVPATNGTTKITWNGICPGSPSPSCFLYESPSGKIVSTSTSGTNLPSSPIGGRLTLILECNQGGAGTTSVSKTVFSGFKFKEI